MWKISKSCLNLYVHRNLSNKNKNTAEILLKLFKKVSKKSIMSASGIQLISGTSLIYFKRFGWYVDLSFNLKVVLLRLDYTNDTELNEEFLTKNGFVC